MGEARLVETAEGLEPEGEGWFVLNVRDAVWWTTDELGAYCPFEGEAKFGQLGINIHLLQPGQPNCMYHRESDQEGFLVLSGECILVVEGQERRLRAWDFFHCPPGTNHVFVGAGSEPSAILMVGARGPGDKGLYPVDEVARKHGAGVDRDTSDGREAYARYRPPERAAPPDGPWGLQDVTEYTAPTAPASLRQRGDAR